MVKVLVVVGTWCDVLIDRHSLGDPTWRKNQPFTELGFVKYEP
jgi:hypothetical protein